MSSTIQQTNRSPQFRNTGPMGRKHAERTGKPEQGRKTADVPTGPDKGFDLSLSGNGMFLAAKKNISHDTTPVNEGTVRPEEQKLSEKARNYLANLREQYGDYDFLVADNVENPLDAAGPSSKKYIVMLSSEEIERMADDEEYAQKVMGKVESAIGTLNEVQDKGLLGEGVHFRRLAISFDENGNTKFFAELERMSAEQRERMEAAKEKRLEEKKAEAKNQEQLPPPQERPAIPGQTELYAAIKAKISIHSMTSEKVFELLQSGSTDRGTSATAAASISQTGTTWEMELHLEAGIRSTTTGGTLSHPMQRPHPYASHQAGHAHGAHRPMPPQEPDARGLLHYM